MDKKQAKAQAKAAKKSDHLILGSPKTVKAFRSPGKGRGGVWTPEGDLTKRSTEAAERNARIRMWQLVVAIIAGIAVVAGVVWQILRTS